MGEGQEGETSDVPLKIRAPGLRSGVSAERRHLKTKGKVCGGLPMRRYEEGESSAVPLKNRAPGFAGHSSAKPKLGVFASW
jgi:hypothetical protein